MSGLTLISVILSITYQQILTLLLVPLNSLMEKIERVQYQAALAVTGTWRSTSRNKIYDGNLFRREDGFGGLHSYLKFYIIPPCLIILESLFLLPALISLISVLEMYFPQSEDALTNTSTVFILMLLKVGIVYTLPLGKQLPYVCLK